MLGDLRSSEVVRSWSSTTRREEEKVSTSTVSCSSSMPPSTELLPPVTSSTATSLSITIRFGCIDTGSLPNKGTVLEICGEFSSAVIWGWDSVLVVFQADQRLEEFSSSTTCSSAMSKAESNVFCASFIALLAIEANLVVSNQLMVGLPDFLWLQN